MKSTNRPAGRPRTGSGPAADAAAAARPRLRRRPATSGGASGAQAAPRAARHSPGKEARPSAAAGSAPAVRPVAREPAVALAARGEQRLKTGHPWIYRSDLRRVAAGPGDVVRVTGAERRALGYGLYSSRSVIALRMLTRRDVRPDAAFWRRRLAAAVRYREALDIDATAYRLVHGEGDRLPGLVVDRYGDVLVVQGLSQATDRLLPLVAELLIELLQPTGILLRNDPQVRTLEGLERKVELCHGAVPQAIEVREGAVRLSLDPWQGQKTGLFLDQRENRLAAARYARGRALDGFSYTGAFALQMAPACDEVEAVDVSESAAASVARNAELNGAANVRSRAANVFDVLRAYDRAGERFDTIVLDPPAFAKNRGAAERALAGYKEINLRALRILAPGGILITSSCSYHVDEPAFTGMLAAAAADARADVRVVEKRLQSRDHPVLATVPETSYLKCVVLRRM